MTLRLRNCLAGALLATLTAVPAQAGDAMFSFGVKGVGGLKFGGGDVRAIVPSLEYQYAFSSLMSLTVSAGYLDYKYTESDLPVTLTSGFDYEEKGKGPVLSADLKFYPGRRMYDGFYFGPGLSAFSAKLDYTHTLPSYTVGVPPQVTTGDKSGTGFEIHAKAGWAFQTGSVVIDPNLQIGYWLSMPKGGKEDSSLGFYALLGVSIGFKF